MKTFKTYISYVIQDGAVHTHNAEIVDLALPKYNFYMDNTSQQVVSWAQEKQSTLAANKKLIIINFFNVSNIK
jgi:hypothetical protein